MELVDKNEVGNNMLIRLFLQQAALFYHNPQILNPINIQVNVKRNTILKVSNMIIIQQQSLLFIRQ